MFLLIWYFFHSGPNFLFVHWLDSLTIILVGIACIEVFFFFWWKLVLKLLFEYITHSYILKKNGLILSKPFREFPSFFGDTQKKTWKLDKFWARVDMDNIESSFVLRNLILKVQVLNLCFNCLNNTLTHAKCWSKQAINAHHSHA